MANKNLAGQKPDFGGSTDEADDPNVLRSPVTTRRYGGALGGTGGLMANPQNFEIERALRGVMGNLGYMDVQPQAPDRDLTQAAAAQIQKTRGY